ncbi:hypothetical protein FRC09_003478 [Ceratobasidium sp. 395]|nr:hypothetical protein FRC09_003478 [Ceratobasidium sp. 395]
MSSACSMYKEGFPGKSRWSVEQIPDLAGQVIIAIAGSVGVGKETCKALLNKGTNVYMAARSKSKADDAIEWLMTETDGKAAEFLQLEPADPPSVRCAVEEFKEKEDKLDVLFNNGGLMTSPH